MATQRNEIQDLTEMGLTLRQAKIYLCLIRTGKQKATTLSKIANIDRSNTYQALAQLHKKGLVTKILGKPTVYEAIDIQEGIATLLEHQKEQYNKINEKAEKLLQLIHPKKALSYRELEEFKIAKYGKETELKKIGLCCVTAKESIDLLLNKKTFHVGVVGNIEPHIEAMKRGVKYRMIIEKIEPKQIPKTFQKLRAELNFQIKYICNTPNAEMVIRDKNSGFISLLPNRDIGKKPILITKNVGCIEIFQTFFDTMWKQAKPYKINKTKQHLICSH